MTIMTMFIIILLEIHQTRPHKGQIQVASRLRALLHSDTYPSEVSGTISVQVSCLQWMQGRAYAVAGDSQKLQECWLYVVFFCCCCQNVYGYDSYIKPDDALVILSSAYFQSYIQHCNFTSFISPQASVHLESLQIQVNVLCCLKKATDSATEFKMLTL